MLWALSPMPKPHKFIEKVQCLEWGAKDRSVSESRNEEKDLSAPCLSGLGCRNTDVGEIMLERSLPREPMQPVLHYSIICLDPFQVSRNFELVGRVNLDQLEQMKEKMESSSSDDEDKDDEMSNKAEDRG